MFNKILKSKLLNDKYFLLLVPLLMLTALGIKNLLDRSSKVSVTNLEIEKILSVNVIDKYLNYQQNLNVNYLTINNDLDYRKYNKILVNNNCNFNNIFDKSIRNKLDRKLVAINCLRLLGAKIGEDYWSLQGINVLQLDDTLQANIKTITGFSLADSKKSSFYNDKSIKQLNDILNYCQIAINNINVGDWYLSNHNFNLAKKIVLVEACTIVNIFIEK